MMFSDWTYWLSSIHVDELGWLLLPLCLLDGLRYLVAPLCVWIYDVARDSAASLFRLFRPVTVSARSSGLDAQLCSEPDLYCPSVTLIIAGLNEEAGLQSTLEKLWGSYPRMEMIVIDDGSTDNMSQVARAFAQHHSGITVITKKRGGKSAAMNAGLAYASGEITIILDADSELAPEAIWKIVQPLRNPSVGGVSGNIRVRNRNRNLLTRLQAYEYLRSIFLGRIVTSRLGILGIVSGAFGAFPTALLRRLGGWDVGPGEDEDLVLRIRKLGLDIAYVPDAECLTDVPEHWRQLTKQRRRWEWAVVTFESRKHIDMAQPFNRHFRLGNFALFVERWLYSLLLPIWFWMYLAWLLWHGVPCSLLYLTSLYYLAYLLGDFIQFLIILYYSKHRWVDAQLGWVLPLMPTYQFYQRLITIFAVLEEILSRRSFRDGFVPEHVRNVTWHW